MNRQVDRRTGRNIFLFINNTRTITGVSRRDEVPQEYRSTATPAQRRLESPSFVDERHVDAFLSLDTRLPAHNLIRASLLIGSQEVRSHAAECPDVDLASLFHIEAATFEAAKCEEKGINSLLARSN